MTGRREFLKTAGAALTTSLFTGNVRGANNRIAIAVIGVGRMGTADMKLAMRQPGVEVVAICDVYRGNLDEAADAAAKQGKQVRKETDFRRILTDKSIDAVCIATPDHWHAYMTVEACKEGKDVYVEKPLCTFLQEGKEMVEAARKYNRVVQAGTQQRSGDHFKKAVDIVRSGQLGTVSFCRTWISSNSSLYGIGNYPDTDPPPGLDWDMWLGPAPKRPFNPNRWGVHPEITPRVFPFFRYFWDYAGGTMTDWGVHLIDVVHWAFGEPMPKSVAGLGGKFWVDDNRETPDTLAVSYEYPNHMVVTFETLENNDYGPLGRSYGIMFHGSRGSLFVDREMYRVVPESGSGLEASEVKATVNSNMAHWANFLKCMRSRQRPVADVEICYRSTTACLLGNGSFRSKLRLDWDPKMQNVVQREAHPFLWREYREPWKLTV